MPPRTVTPPITSVPEYGICPETNLPEKPPTEHFDGTIRFRICKKCRESKPLKSFGRIIRRVDTPFGDKGIYRRRTCTACHDASKARKRSQIERRRVQKRIAQATAEIRRKDSADIILGIVDRLACDVGGDLERLCEIWVSLMNDPKTSRQQKLNSIQTFVYMLTVAERMKVAERNFESINPADYLMWLAERKLLGGLFRAALNDGLLTWDDIDPPPA